MEALIGWLGNAFFIGGGFYKRPKTTMIFYVIGNGLYMIMYLKMGLLMAAVAVGLMSVRNLSGIFLNDRQNFHTQIVLTVALSFIIFSSMQYGLDVLILLAGWAVAMAYFYREEFLPFRFYNSVSQILWIVHSSIFGVWPMLFTAVLILATNIYAVIVFTPTLRQFFTAPFVKFTAEPDYVPVKIERPDNPYL